VHPARLLRRRLRVVLRVGFREAARLIVRHGFPECLDAARGVSHEFGDFSSPEQEEQNDRHDKPVPETFRAHSKPFQGWTPPEVRFGSAAPYRLQKEDYSNSARMNAPARIGSETARGRGFIPRNSSARTLQFAEIVLPPTSKECHRTCNSRGRLNIWEGAAAVSAAHDRSHASAIAARDQLAISRRRRLPSLRGRWNDQPGHESISHDRSRSARSRCLEAMCMCTCQRLTVARSLLQDDNSTCDRSKHEKCIKNRKGSSGPISVACASRTRFAFRTIARRIAATGIRTARSEGRGSMTTSGLPPRTGDIVCRP